VRWGCGATSDIFRGFAGGGLQFDIAPVFFLKHGAGPFKKYYLFFELCLPVSVCSVVKCPGEEMDL
jgi:hypothetical protein